MGPHYDEAIRQQEIIAAELARLDERRTPMAGTEPGKAMVQLSFFALALLVPIVVFG
ncbi:MAG: hypothetical protein AAF409_02665 [Pseudomonadota bacterium]